MVAPELCVITPVDYDHPTFLGDTVEQIAGEKAGILKPGVPAIFARQRPESAAVIERRAREVGAPFERAADASVTMCGSPRAAAASSSMAGASSAHSPVNIR